MTDEEEIQYDTLKSQYPNTVLLLKVSIGHWAARHGDMDHVLSVCPDATLGRNFVSFDDKWLDKIIAALEAKGLGVAKAEQIAKAPKGVEIESLPLMHSRFFECSNDDGLTWQPMPLKDIHFKPQ